jgi:hypothetical protein
MEKISLSFEVSATSSANDVSVSVFLDQAEIFSAPASALPQRVDYEFNDVEGQHVLAIQMSGKTQEHTQIDGEGNIIDDVLVGVKNVELDGINIDKLIWSLANYQHDFNGTQPTTTMKFYGTMGCNGTVSLEFTTPVYLWLLENM